MKAIRSTLNFWTNMDQNVQQDIENIHERNRRVEADKAWEVSWTRRLIIAVVTYVIAGIWLVTIHDTVPWLKAFVPAGGYILSTLTLKMAKLKWIRRYMK